MNVLYRLYDTHNCLLYIGISTSIGLRLGQHGLDKPWFPSVTTIRLEHHPDIHSLRAAEKTAIDTEQPIFNATGIGHSHRQDHYDFLCPIDRNSDRTASKVTESDRSKMASVTASQAPDLRQHP